jgi:NAD(P)-dependent dehydrogenase (short-subunit alcohol dehydrogenase family)
VDIDREAAERTAASLPAPAIGLAADVADPAGVDRYIAAAVDEFGRVDLHHLNAGVSGDLVELPDSSVEDFDHVLAVNVRGVYLGIRAAFRRYREQRSAGNIVVTASIGSLRGSADLIAYQTSKAAVLGLTRGSAIYGGPLGIRVNAVAPGIVPTELFAASGQSGGRDDMVRRASTTPLRRAGTSDEIGNVVAFLLSDASAYITGETVSADGGAAAVSSVRSSGGAGAWSTQDFDRDFYRGLREG